MDLFSSVERKLTKYDKSFAQAYAKLNPEQKDAVDTIQGPVMVNAGPGTGKTQILATRIGKILQETDAAPHNILCLTYTDAATVAMRKRLVEFIGPVAHQIHIYTFHGFCNQVIQENLDIFGGYRQLEAITDLENVDVFRKILDDLADEHPLKRFKYDKYYEGKRMKHLFELMKKENLSPEITHKQIDAFLEKIKSCDDNKDPLYIKYKYRRNYKEHKAGDLKPINWKEVNDKMDLLRSAVDQFENYGKIMSDQGLYDFNDMILWVLNHFNKNENLLLRYQERYHYFLVDEFQDTNGSQNELIDLLISYWDKPNIFVVGDDDQAIYKFQGANLGNIKNFKKKYAPYTIVLEKNYRSNQFILNKAKDLIEFNKERLILEVPELSKELKAAGQYKANQTLPTILCYDKLSHEYADLAYKLKMLHEKSPNELRNVAVIYRKHKQVEDLVDVLEKLEVPINIKKRINILELPIIQNLINILSYLNEEMINYEDGQHRLFEILHYKYFGIYTLDVGKIALHCQKGVLDPSQANSPDGKKKKIYPKWREVISDQKILDSLNLSDVQKVLEVSSLFDRWMSEIPIITLQTLFGKILNEGGVLRHIMSSNNKAWLLQVVSTFFDLIKKETAKNPQLDLKSLLAMIKKMEENDIQLPINKTITSEDGLNFVTAHSAKGLEFKKVFMLGCTENIWNGTGKFMNQFSYPDTLNADNKSNIEDERRLFYVAMTRAETDLVISFSETNEEGKKLGPATFVDELRVDSEIENLYPKVSEDILAEFYFKLLERKQQTIPLIEKNLIDDWMNGYKLSVTHLNKYLKCPLSFYFESILKVPSARNASTGFGTAMHHALNKFFEKIEDPTQRSLDRMLYHFEENLVKHRSHFTQDEFKSYLTHGKMTLEKLYNDQLEAWLAVPKYALEEELAHAVYKGVPLKGFIDKVEVFKDHVNVVDYKTGKYRPEKLRRPNDKDEKGGDYWRQIVFYKMLLDSDTKNGWKMATGKISFIEPDRKSGEFATKEFAVLPEDLQVVGQQITETYENIKAYKFDQTCEDADCRWCNFTNNNYELKEDLEEQEYSIEDSTSNP